MFLTKLCSKVHGHSSVSSFGQVFSFGVVLLELLTEALAEISWNISDCTSLFFLGALVLFPFFVFILVEE